MAVALLIALDEPDGQSPTLSKSNPTPPHLTLFIPLINNSARSAASGWFRASEASGDFMGIRYGRVPQGSQEVEWSFVSHCECDGIGGFARVLRKLGAELPELPETKNPCGGVFGPLWRLWRGCHEDRGCADRRDWAKSVSLLPKPSDSVAWHLFSEQETDDIRERCKRIQVTVNSHLLKRLDEVIRPEIQRAHLRIPWMVPVNLRGDIRYAEDTENHVSCVEVRIAPDDTAVEIQEQIRRRLSRGEHRANHLLFGLGNFLSHEAKLAYLTKDRARLAGNIGAFSNLGVWDSEMRINTTDSWLFCPPVVNGQLLGAGCVTFQNRLGLAIQRHAGLSGSPDVSKAWMSRWVDGIRMDE